MNLSGDVETRCSDQINYQVHMNSEPFDVFVSEYSGIYHDYEKEFEELSRQMEQYYISRKQPQEEFERKMQFCNDLKNAIQRHCPNWRFHIVPTGSTTTGLAVKNSDLDVAIHIPQAGKIFRKFVDGEEVIDKRKASLKILQIVRRILENDEEIKDKIRKDRPYNIQLVPAQIQILRINTTDGIECDISVVAEPFLSSMHNSFLLKHLVQIDPRFAPLCAVVKEWADRTEIKKPKEGGFNSYAMVLLVVHFLQCGTYPPVLPHLPRVYENQRFFAESERNFPTRLDFGAPLPRPLPDVSPNPFNTAQLFFQFVCYLYRFNFSKSYMSMTSAMVKSRRDAIEEKVRAQDMKEVYIEDPFDDHNPGRTVRTMSSIRDMLKMTIALFRKLDDDDANFKFPTLDDIFNVASREDIELNLLIDPEDPLAHEKLAEGEGLDHIIDDEDDDEAEY